MQLSASHHWCTMVAAWNQCPSPGPLQRHFLSICIFWSWPHTDSPLWPSFLSSLFKDSIFPPSSPPGTNFLPSGTGSWHSVFWWSGEHLHYIQCFTVSFVFLPLSILHWLICSYNSLLFLPFVSFFILHHFFLFKLLIIYLCTFAA